MTGPALSRLQASNHAKLAWLIQVRWTAVAALFAGVAIGHFIGFIRDHFVFPSFSIAFALGGWNAFSVWWCAASRQVSDWHLALQLSADALILTLALSWSGGSSNPLIPIVLMHASLGPMLLRRAGPAWAFSAVEIACIAFLSFQTVFPLAPSEVHSASTTLFLSYLIVGGTIWLLIAWLSKSMRIQAQALEALRDKTSRLDHLRAMGALSAGFAHEFATPLNTIAMRMERLSRKIGPDLQEEAEVALEAARDCERTLRHFMDSRVEPEHIHLKQVPFEPTIRELVAHHAVSQRQPPAEIASRLAAPGFVEVPLIAFSQSILGLLDNALEHSPASSPIRIELRWEAGAYCCEIRDSGPGFPASVVDHFGTPFLTTKPGGTGLGLYNALVLAQALGGSLAIGNAGPGGIATLSIPPAQTRASDPA